MPDFNIFDDFDEEAFLAAYGARNENRNNSLISVYTLLILQEKTDESHPISQVKLGKILNDRYEVQVARQTISRTLHTMEDSGFLNIYHNNKGWYVA